MLISGYALVSTPYNAPNKAIQLVPFRNIDVGRCEIWSTNQKVPSLCYKILDIQRGAEGRMYERLLPLGPALISLLTTCVEGCPRFPTPTVEAIFTASPICQTCRQQQPSFRSNSPCARFPVSALCPIHMGTEPVSRHPSSIRTFSPELI